MQASGCLSKLAQSIMLAASRAVRVPCYAVWPAVNIITFRYIPQDLRILFGSAIGLFWVSILCTVSLAQLKSNVIDTFSCFLFG